MRGLITAVAALTILASPASAAQMIANFKGTAAFLHPEGFVSEEPWWIRFYFDTTAGHGDERRRAGGWLEDYHPDCPKPCSTPISGGTFFFRSQLYSFDTSTYSGIGTQPGVSFGFANEGFNQIVLDIFTPDAPARLDTPFHGQGYGTGLWKDKLGLTVLSVTVSPVPEPSTWAMLIAGFGLLGAALRKRRAALLTL
jgi:hypothetical protein